MSEFRIGQVAAQAGVSVDTVRYYERRRLLPRAMRTVGRFRIFAPEAVERIRFIKQAQEIGLSLEEIKELLADGGGAEKCQRVSELLHAKLEEIDRRINTMRSLRRTLAYHIAACKRELDEKGEAAKCPAVLRFGHASQK